MLKNLLGACALLALTSCLGDGTSSYTEERPLATATNYTYVTDTDDNTTAIYAGADYRFKFDYTAGTVGVTVTDLQIAPGTSRISFTTDPVKFTYNTNGGGVISIPTIPAGNHTITGFKCIIHDRIIVNGTRVANYYDISYTVDARYDIRVIMPGYTFDGTLEITNLETNATETVNTAYFRYSLDIDKRLLSFSICNLTIGGKSYSEINFKDLPCTYSTQGISVAPQTADIIPTSILNQPIADLTARDFVFTVTYAPEMRFSFQVPGKYNILGTTTLTIPTPIQPR